MTSQQPPPTTDLRQLRHLLADLQGLVRFHRELGITDYPASPALHRFLQPPTAPDRGRRPPAEKPPGARTASPPRPAAVKIPAPRATGSAPRSLDVLEEQIKGCQRCPRHQWRQQVIFGQGPPQARLLLIGPAPGPEEERRGLPCQGEAGALLDRMLAAINLSRRQVYLTTLIKCVPFPPDRPSTAEPPTAGEAADEMAARECLTFLQQQIAAIRPTLICTLGPLPAQALLRTSKNLLQLRGRFHKYHNIELMPTLAPEFLLHNPEMKKAAWQDLQLIQRRLKKS